MDESCDHPDCELMPRPPSRRSLPTVATVEGERKGKRMARRLLEDCCASNQAARLEESCDSHGLEVSWQVHVHVFMYMYVYVCLGCLFSFYYYVS